MPSPDDYLDLEAGVLAPSASFDYHLALRRVLLPDPLRLVQMVVLPSFDPERAVYVTAERRRAPRERIVVAGRLRTQLWGAAMARALRTPAPQGLRPALLPGEDAFLGIAAEVEWARAPIGDDAYRRVHAAWEGALLSARPREGLGPVLEGVHHHFATPQRSGATHDPPPGSVCADLVALGFALAELAAAAERDRPARERAVAADADRLLARIQARRALEARRRARCRSL